jgi:hypothetical protein
MSKASIWRDELPAWGSIRLSTRAQPGAAIRMLHADSCIDGLFQKKSLFLQHRRGGVDFLPDAPVNEYHRFPLVEMIPIAREETYWLRGDNR